MKLIPKREVSQGKRQFFHRCVHKNEPLMEKLHSVGYSVHQKQLKPIQVKIIEQHFNNGE